MSLLVVGSVAFDALESPYGKVERVVGGAATYFAVAASFFAHVSIVAIVGDDFTEKDAAIFRGRRIDTEGLEHAPGKLWRSRYDAEQNLIVVNSGHRDFIYASRAKALKLRYLVRLYAKEMVRKNFPGLPAEQLLDRLIELSLYTEEHLR